MKFYLKLKNVKDLPPNRRSGFLPRQLSIDYLLSKIHLEADTQ